MEHEPISITRANTDKDLVLSWLYSKPSTLTRQRYLKNYEQWLSFSNLTLKETRVEDIQDYRTMLEMKGYKPATISQKLNSIKSLFTYAVKVGYIAMSPCVVVKAPVVHEQISTKLITVEDVKKLVEGARCQRDGLILKFLFALGLRVSELLKMRWDDFYFLPGGKVKIKVIGKGNKKRELLVPNDMYEELLMIREGDNPWVFHAPLRHNPLRSNTVFYMIKKIAKQVGVSEDISAHWLRHSHATESLRNGCDLSLLMQSLGHSSITTTQKYLCLREAEGSSSYINLG